MAASVGLTNYVSGTVTVFVKRKVLECVSSAVRTPPACSNTSRVRCTPEACVPLCRRTQTSALTGGRRLAGVVRVLVKIFSASAWIRIGRATARNRIRSSFITHLRGETADAVFVQQVAQRAHRHLQKTSCVGLIAVGPPERFHDIRLLQLVQMRGEVNAFARQF